MNNFKEQVKYEAEQHAAIRTIAAKILRPVVDAIPVEKREEREIAEGRFLSACELTASVVSLFTAYRTIFEGTPNGPALLRALTDLSFGFETNQFYATFRGYLHPILMNSINTWLDSVEYSVELAERDSQTTRFLTFATQHSWLEVCSAISFCLGGTAFSRQYSKTLRDEIYKVI